MGGLRKITETNYFKQIKHFIKTKSFIGFEGVPIFEVGRYFKKAVWEGTLGTRSASLAFNFFLAVFPGLLFLVSLIPFVPLDGFYEKLLVNLNDILPSAIKEPVLDTIKDLIQNEREGILIFNILLTLYFASNGIDNLMTQFNNTNLFHEKRAWWKKRVISIFLVVLLTVLLFTGVILITFTKELIEYFFSDGWLGDSVNWIYVNFGRWLIVVGLFYFAISFLYYFGPAKRKQWKFFSAGSSTATVLIILTSLGFSYYVNHFSQYNAIYGSIGTIIIVMLYFQLNSFVLLLGFELNASIRKGKFEYIEKSSESNL
jgi:membrane protein